MTQREAAFWAVKLGMKAQSLTTAASHAGLMVNGIECATLSPAWLREASKELTDCANALLKMVADAPADAQVGCVRRTMAEPWEPRVPQ